jgi:hypothetical protein
MGISICFYVKMNELFPKKCRVWFVKWGDEKGEFKFFHKMFYEYSYSFETSQLIIIYIL